MQELKGQAKQGAQRREAIVDAALDVFAQRGYRAGALTEIAEILGVPDGTARSRLHYAVRQLRIALDASSRPGAAREERPA